MKTRTLFLNTIALMFMGITLVQEQASAQYDIETNLFPIQYQGKEGCINKSGELVITPRFDRIYCYSSEEKIGFQLDGKYGFVNKNDDIVISPLFDGISIYQGFREGLASVQKGKKRGFINAAGEFVIEPQFESAEDFEEGLAAVKINGKWGFIDKIGTFVIEPKFDHVDNFHDGLSRVEIYGKMGVIDRSGKFTIPPIFDRMVGKPKGYHPDYPVPAFINGSAGWGLINRRGEFVVKPQFNEMAGYFNYNPGEFTGMDTPLPVKSGRQWGYIDVRTGAWVVKPQFDQAYQFSEGLAPVTVGGKTGFIDKNGQFIIKPKFDDVHSFRRGKILVRIGKKYALIDRNGRSIQIEFDWINWATTSTEADLFTVGYVDERRTLRREGYVNLLGNYVTDKNVTKLPKKAEVAKKDEVEKPIESNAFNVAQIYQSSSEFGAAQLSWNSKLDEIKSATKNDFGLPKLPTGSFLEDTIFVKNGQNSLCTVDIRGFWDKSAGCQTATYLDYIKLKYHIGAQNALIRDLENPSIISAENELYSQLKATNPASMNAFELSLKQSRSAIDAGNLDSGLFGFTVYAGKLLNTTALQTGTFFKKGVATGLTIAPDVIVAVSDGVFSEIKKLKDMLEDAKEIEPLSELFLKMSGVIPEYYDAFKSNDPNKQFNAGVKLNLIVFDAIIEMKKHPKLAKLSALKDLIDDYNASKEIENLLKDESIDAEDKVFLQSAVMFSMIKNIGNLSQFIPGMSSLSDILKSGVTTLDGARQNNLAMSLANKYEKLERADKVNRQVLEFQRQRYDDFSSRITDLLAKERPALVRKRSNGAIETSIKGQVLLGQ